ncbi:SAM-dependent methyltransferase, partial [Xanthomonas euvesicatoria]
PSVMTAPCCQRRRAPRAPATGARPRPGPWAGIPGLGVPARPRARFGFGGFLPAKSAARRERLARLAGETRTLVFYESSHRIFESLADLRLAFGDDRPAVIARELTKLFETVLDGSLAQLQAQVEADDNQRKGEFVVMVQGAADAADGQLAEGRRVYAKLAEHLPPSTAAKLAAELTGAPRKALYGG